MNIIPTILFVLTAVTATLTLLNVQKSEKVAQVVVFADLLYLLWISSNVTL